MNKDDNQEEHKLEDHTHEYGAVSSRDEALMSQDQIGGKYTWFEQCDACGSSHFKLTTRIEENGEEARDVWCAECGRLQGGYVIKEAEEE